MIHPGHFSADVYVHNISVSQFTSTALFPSWRISNRCQLSATNRSLTTEAIMPMPTPNSGRDVLNHTLSILLGFDDGVADVVDHLLAIETSEVSSRCGSCRHSSRAVALHYCRAGRESTVHTKWQRSLSRWP
jgi:hypothetical protein